ncbi:hypothetical protein AAIR98_000888 [Elusimicrobium simillimum]|uniref:hypothetical protein n=1 Tax=Elusimicrobium simillimum TaxID=3143438 RepID=UPI003C6ED644
MPPHKFLIVFDYYIIINLQVYDYSNGNGTCYFYLMSSMIVVTVIRYAIQNHNAPFSIFVM